MNFSDNKKHADDPPVLTRAIESWRRGHDVPLDIEVQLLELGFDVETLRHKYQNHQ